MLPPVAIFDANAPTALAFARSLGRRGVPVHVFAPSRWPVARWSRYCSQAFTCPDPDDLQVFGDWLRTQIESQRIQRIAPTSDLIAWHVARVHEFLPPRVQAITPDSELVNGCLLKDRFKAQCDTLGQAVPGGALPLSHPEAGVMAAQLRYPLILKPKSHIGVGLARGCVVFDADELMDKFAPYRADASTIAFDENPELRWPMLEEYIPGALDSLYSVSGFLAADGRVLAKSLSRKIHQWPTDLGIGTVFEPAEDDALIDQGVAVVKSLLGRGVFEIEMIHHPQANTWMTVDLNPRAHGHIALDIARGHDLPWLWYETSCGRTPAALGRARNDAVWVHSVPDSLRRAIKVIKGPHRRKALGLLAGLATSRNVDIVHSNADPLPTLPFVASMLRHPGGLIRPLWRGSSMT